MTTLTEAQGTSVLKRRFQAAGLTVEENVEMTVAGKAIRIDGFDRARNVGYEFITTEAGDRAELTTEVVAELEARMRRGEMYLLLIDELEVGDESTLVDAADHFLRVVAARKGFSLGSKTEDEP